MVCTGGEPLLQLDAPLIDALHAAGFEIAVETNGTLPAPAGLDWICVSPKADAPLAQTRGQELKLVYPAGRASIRPRFEDLDFRALPAAADGRAGPRWPTPRRPSPIASPTRAGV